MSIAGKVTYFTAMFPYVVLVILFAYSLTLEGAGRGIAAYLTPDLAALMNPEAWIAAGNQGHHSIGEKNCITHDPESRRTLRRFFKNSRHPFYSIEWLGPRRSSCPLACHSEDS